MDHQFHRLNSTGSLSDSSNHHQTHLASLSSRRSLSSVLSLNLHSNINNPYSTASHTCLTTLIKPINNNTSSSYTSSLTLSGKFLYTGSSDREIRSWNRTELLNNLQQQPITTNSTFVAAGKGAVKSLVVRSDKLFTAHQDHKIRVWKIITTNNQEQDQQQQQQQKQKYTRLATLPTLSDRVTKLLVPKNHVQIRRHKKCTWVHHVDTVSSLALSKDGTLLYSVSWDRTIKVWRTKDFACLESVTNAHDDAINAVAVSDDGGVYTGSADKKIKVWKKLAQGDKKKQRRKHTLVDTLEKHNSGINALALSSDGSLLYSGACDRSILVWEKEEEGEGKMVVVGAIRGHTRSILCLVVVLDLVCSGSEDKTIRVWRGVCREYYCVAVLEGHRGPIKSLTAEVDHCDDPSEASFLVYSGSLDCDVKVWQVFVPLL